MDYKEQQEIKELRKLRMQISTRGVLISLRDLREVRDQIIFNLNITQ